MVLRCTLLLLTLWPTVATAGQRSLLLVAGVAGAVPRDRAVHARLGQPVELRAVVREKHGRQVRYYADVPRFFLRGRLVRGRRLLPLSRLGAARWRWYRVEPRPHHVNTAPPNKGNKAYSNARLFGKNHGRWIGYDNLEYHESLIPGSRTALIRPTRTRPSHPRVDVNGGLGTMRYKVQLQLGSETLSSPGMEAQRRGGISPAVMRVTFRSGDDLVGHLHGFFNVPNVFGSAGHGDRHQTDLYQGADCADVIIGAVRAAGYRMPYTSVSGLKRYTRKVTRRLLLTREGLFVADGPRRGQRAVVAFGAEGLHPGDLMLIDYYGFTGSPRSWDHIAVVDRDRGTRGRFDPADPVLHMGYLFGLIEEPALGEAPAYVQFLRFRPKVLRALQRARRRSARSKR